MLLPSLLLAIFIRQQQSDNPADSSGSSSLFAPSSLAALLFGLSLRGSSAAALGSFAATIIAALLGLSLAWERARSLPAKLRRAKNICISTEPKPRRRQRWTRTPALDTAVGDRSSALGSCCCARPAVLSRPTSVWPLADGPGTQLYPASTLDLDNLTQASYS